MPAEEGVGSEDEQRFLPILDTAGKEDELQAIGLGKEWLFDLAVHAKRDELLAEQGIFGDEVGPTTCEVGSGTEHNRVTGGLGEVEKGWFNWTSLHLAF